MKSTKYSQEVYLKKIIDDLPHAIFWKDCNSVFLGCNTAFAKNAGFNSAKEIVGKTDYDMPWKEKAVEYVNIDKKVISTQKKQLNYEEKNLNSTVLVSKVPILSEDSNVIGVLGVYTDITEKKQIEDLIKQKEIAEKNSEVMNILSGSIAHEIRTPLSIIKINADLMTLSSFLKKAPLTTNKKKFLEILKNLHQALKECSQVVTMLLAKIRKLTLSNNNVETLENCFIKNIIEAALAEYPFRENEIKIVHYFSERNQNFCFKGEETFVKHVLFNLLKNSLYAINEADKGEIFIETKIDTTGNYLIFRDTALGIPPEYLPIIFDKFETTDDAHSGTGLGLAFCKYVMESYGGKIICNSEFGKFTEFVLFFPFV